MPQRHAQRPGEKCRCHGTAHCGLARTPNGPESCLRCSSRKTSGTPDLPCSRDRANAPTAGRRRSRGSASGSLELDRSRGGRVQDKAAKARHRPTTDRAQMQSHAPGDRPAPPLQGRTNKTAVLGPALTDPSWPVPAADRVNVRESLFAEAFNRLLQQNPPTTDSCTATNSIVILSPHRRGQATLTNRDFCAVSTPARWACQCLDDKRIAKRTRDYLHKENAMPRTKVSVPDVAEVAPGLWSNAIRAGDMLFISGQVARPFEGGTGIVGKDEYEQTRQIFSRIDRIIKAAGGTMDNLVKMTIYVVDIKNNTEVWRARREFFTGDFPASTLVEVRSLANPEVLVEIETVAYLGKS